MPDPINIPNNAEIDAALKEFEIKSQAEQAQKAPEVSTNSDLPKIVQLVMKYSGGAIKEQKQAEYVLLGFVVVALVISLYLFLGGRQSQPKITPAMLEIMKQMPTNK